MQIIIRIDTSGIADTNIRLHDTDDQSWIRKACERVGRNLTWQERQTYLPGETYRATCEQWPLSDDVP